MSDIYGTNGADSLIGTTGADYIYGFLQGSNPDAETGADSLSGGGGSDWIVGGGGNDRLFGDESFDFLFGGLGNDSLNGGASFDSLEGGQGSDWISGDDGDDQIIDDDIGQVTAGNDTLLGGIGNDYIESRGGNDTVFGGDGTDMLLLARSASTSATTLVVSGSTATFGGTTISGIEAIEIQGGSANDIYTAGDLFQRVTFHGNGGADRLTAGSGTDALFGGDAGDTLAGNAGNDFLDGGLGVDTLTGGTGNDIYVVDVTTDLVIEDNAAATEIDTVRSTATFTLGNNLEHLTLEGTAAINGTGNGLDNRLTGNDGSNTLIGGAGNDTLDGRFGIDKMEGGTGNDSYEVDNAADVVVEASTVPTEIDSVKSSVSFVLGANLENLTLAGTAISGTGNAGNNILTGNSGANTLFGDAGNDSLVGGLGADSMTGGAGNDTYSVDNALDVVTEAATVGEVDTVISSIAYSLAGTNIENLTLVTATGVLVAVTGTGNASNNTIIGNTGNNSLIGDAGADSLSGGVGNDMLDGGTGTDTLRGGSGNDIYIVDSSADVVTETSMVGNPPVAKDEGGTDRVESSATFTLGNFLENLTLTGGTAAINGTGNGLANTLVGNDGNNILVGDAGSDSLNGGMGADLLRGGAGNDTYGVDNAGDVVTETGTSGADELGRDLVISSVNFILGDYIENLTLTGTAAINGTGNGSNNSLVGNDGSNILSGDAGSDILNGGKGVDTLYGGAGNDSYTIDDAGDFATEASVDGVDDGGRDQVTSSVTVLIGDFIETLYLAGPAAINGTGNAQNNLIRGNGAANVLNGGDGNDSLEGGIGNDSLIGGDGNDVLIGGIGNDDLRGGAGNDIYTVEVVGDVVTEASSAGTDLVKSAVSFTLGSFVENLTLDGTGALSGTGNTGNNVLTGNAGSNTLTGLGGNDSLFGGTGSDRMLGGAGNDVYKVDSSGDQVRESTNGTTDDGGTDLVISTVTHTLADFVENLTLDLSSSINGTGNVLNNILLGNSGRNTLTGLAGNDTIDGKAGVDRMLGGAGNDTYRVDSTFDVVSESTNGTTDDGGTDSVTSSATFTLATFVENLTLDQSSSIHGTGNASNNNLTGNSGNNSLTGLAGNDTLTGNAGADTLDGGAGNDRLIGGTGADRFVFNNSTGMDSVVGFVTKFDGLVFNDDVFTAINDQNNDRRVDSSQFVLGTAAKDANDVLIYDKAGGDLYYDANGSAAGGRVQIASFAAGTILALGDLFII